MKLKEQKIRNIEWICEIVATKRKGGDIWIKCKPTYSENIRAINIF